MCLQFDPGISHSFFLSLEFEPGHYVVARAYRAAVGGERACNVRRQQHVTKNRFFGLARKFCLMAYQPVLFEI